MGKKTNRNSSLFFSLLSETGLTAGPQPRYYWCCVSGVLLRKQESGDGMRSMDLPYVGEDETLSWCRGFIMHAGICPPATTQHDAPLLTVLYWQPSPMYISQEVNLVGRCRKKGEIKKPRHFDNIFKAFIPFCPVKKLGLWLWDLKVSHGNLLRGSSWTLNLSAALIPEPLSSSYPACIYSPSMLCLRLQLYSFVFYRS